MKSRTSFSKLTTFKKDITRFAPIWALYLIGMMLVLMESSFVYSYDRFARNYLPGVIKGFSVVNLIYAGVCAVMLFGDLYNTRMCYSLHTLPQRRESWLVSHLASGFLFSLVPNIVAALYFMTQLQDYWFLALYWLLAAELQFIFYYGVATFSALLTGNRFAMLLVYALISFVSMLAYWVVETIYLPQMPGVILDFSIFSKLCPTVELIDSFGYFEFERVDLPTKNQFGEYDYIYEYVGLTDGWGYTAILALIGLVMMGLSVLLYRLRHLESAGDFVAFPKIKSVACVILTVCVAGVFAFVGDAMLGSAMIPWLIVGLIVGYFGSLMLLERRVKVFRGKTFLGLGVLAAVLVASFLMVTYDVFGVVNWTPEAKDVKSVTVANFNSNGVYDYDYYYGNRISVTLTETEQIADIIEAHEDILERMGGVNHSNVHRVVLTYKLDNGRTVKRGYSAPASGVNYEIISKYFYTPQQILGYTDWETYVRQVEFIYFEGMEVAQSQYEAVLEALKKDCESGYVTTETKQEAEYWVEIQTRDDRGETNYRQLQVLPGAENIIALLKTPQMILGYSDWEEYLERLYYVSVSGMEIPEAYRQELLEALRKDCEDGNISARYDQVALYDIQIELEYLNGRRDYRYLYITVSAKNTVDWLEEHSNLLK